MQFLTFLKNCSLSFILTLFLSWLFFLVEEPQQQQLQC